MDANVSVRPAGSAELRTRCEIKNLTRSPPSARPDLRARPESPLYESGGSIEQRTMASTRRRARCGRCARRKRATTAAHPSPHPTAGARRRVARGRARGLPELPAAKRARFAEQYGLSPVDGRCAAERDQAELLRDGRAKGGSPRPVATWMMNDVDGPAPRPAGLGAGDRQDAAALLRRGTPRRAAVSQSVDSGRDRAAGRWEAKAGVPRAARGTLAAGAPSASAARLPPGRSECSRCPTLARSRVGCGRCWAATRARWHGTAVGREGVRVPRGAGDEAVAGKGGPQGGERGTPRAALGRSTESARPPRPRHVQRSQQPRFASRRPKGSARRPSRRRLRSSLPPRWRGRRHSASAWRRERPRRRGVEALGLRGVPGDQIVHHQVEDAAMCPL